MIFLDSSYIKATILKNDPFADQSRSMEPYLEHEAKVTNITVLLEVLNSVNHYNFFGDVNELRKSLLEMSIFDYLSSDDYRDAFELFKYFDWTINFADCTILQSMFNHGIQRIASFDSDFDKIKGIDRIYGFS